MLRARFLRVAILFCVLAAALAGPMLARTDCYEAAGCTTCLYIDNDTDKVQGYVHWCF